MDSLFLLQFTCFLFVSINAIILGITRLQIKWMNRRYEKSRWLIFAAMVGLALQFLAQMGGEFRAKGDDEGAIFNMLVYPPCFTLIAMGIYNIEAMHANLRKMNVVCATIYAAILAIFGVGYSQSGSFHVGNWLYVMVFLFGVNLAYCHVMIIVEIRKRRKMLEEMAGNDILPYVRFARASVIILLLLIIAMPVAVLSSDFLYVIGPLELLALLFFIISFVSLGYNYNPAEELLDKDVEENYAVMENGQMETTQMETTQIETTQIETTQIETTQIETTETESTQTEIEQTESAQTENGGEAAPCAEEQNVEQDKKEETLQQQFAAARQKIIREKLDAWCAGRGYKDTSVNMISLARSLSITKTELSRYLSSCYNTTFRIWLAEVRFEAAKQMILEHPDYSNDVISAECGFSSRSYLYRMFKEKEGCSPTAWKEKNS